MRLIDAEALLDKIPKEWTIMDVGRVVTAPTVDAEPVIRCKDCIHCRKTEYSYDCELFRDMAIGLDDYCSSAVRDEKGW